MPDDAWARLLGRLAENAPQPGQPFSQMRADLEKSTAPIPVPDRVTVEPVEVGALAGEWLRPTGRQPDRIVLYFHGGGYVLGSLATHRVLAARLALSTGADVLTVEYGLGPEAAFPRAVRDAVDAYKWLRAARPDAAVAVAGDSAGGGLAVAMNIVLRDAGLPLPASVVCLSPWSDLALAGLSIDANDATDPQVSRALLEEMARGYLAGADSADPLASPVHADLRGLPPMLIQVGGGECLRDDGQALADAARRADVDVTFESWDGMFHVWHALAPRLPQAQQALARVGDWLREHWEE